MRRCKHKQNIEYLRRSSRSRSRSYLVELSLFLCWRNLRICRAAANNFPRAMHLFALPAPLFEITCSLKISAINLVQFIIREILIFWINFFIEPVFFFLTMIVKFLSFFEEKILFPTQFCVVLIKRKKCYKIWLRNWKKKINSRKEISSCNNRFVRINKSKLIESDYKKMYIYWTIEKY